MQEQLFINSAWSRRVWGNMREGEIDSEARISRVDFTAKYLNNLIESAN